MIDKISRIESYNYYWSLGSHHEWNYDIRVWKKFKNLKVECHIFTGQTLEICLQKFNQWYDEQFSNSN